MPTPTKSSITFVLDLETTGNRAFMGTREQIGLQGHRRAMQPPRITQFALSKYEHIGEKVVGTKLLIGSGPDRGYTTVLQEALQKNKIVNPSNLPESFYADLAKSGLYDPSVRIEGSLLNDQVKKHVKHLMQSGGKAQTAEQHIRSFMSHVDDALTKVDSVNVLAYNKGFDVDTIVRELGHTNPDLQKNFTSWYEELTSSGKMVMQAGERPVHQAMFERMLDKPDYVPEFTKGHSFDVAQRAGKAAEEIGTETLQKHHALRAYVDDVAKMSKGGEIYKGLSSELQGVFKGIQGKEGEALYAEFEKIGQILDNKPELKLELRNYYKSIVKAKHGEEVAAHMIDFNKFDFVKGWKQEMVGKALGEATESAHDAVDDIGVTWEINRKLNVAKSAKDARTALAQTMASEEYRKAGQQLAYKSWQMESPGFTKATGEVAEKLIQESSRGASWIAKAAGKMGKSKSKVAMVVGVAAAMATGYKLARSLKVQHARSQYTAPFEEKLEGLRNPYSNYLVSHGIQPSEYPYGNVSDFGSGRKNFQDPNMGFSVHPDVGMARQIFAQAGIQRRMAWEEANSKKQLIPNTFRRSDYNSDGLIDTAEWLMDLADVDTVRMRRAWIDRNVPIIGGIFATVQKIGLRLLENIAGRDFTEQIAPSVSVAMSGVSMPANTGGQFGIQLPMSGESQDIAEKLLDSSAYLRVDESGGSRGQYVGTFTSRNNRDINRNIVLWGGAMSTNQQYMSAQQSAQST